MDGRQEGGENDLLDGGEEEESEYLNRGKGEKAIAERSPGPQAVKRRLISYILLAES